jgi:hypothetical protein
MHSAFKHRLEQLERERAIQTAPSFILCICFVRANGKPGGAPVEAVIATDQKGFVCHRGKDESLDEFKSRAIDELRALHPVGPPRSLIFFSEEPSDAARS